MAIQFSVGTTQISVLERDHSDYGPNLEFHSKDIVGSYLGDKAAGG